jgi:uncharacterized protein
VSRIAPLTIAAALALSATTHDARAAAVAPSTASAPAAAPSQETMMTPEAAAAVEAWRAKRIARLEAPDGWLSLVGLEWLDEGVNKLGSAADAGVHFPDKVPATLGTITRHEATLTLEPAPGADLTIDGKPVVGKVTLASDDSEGGPTVVSHGSIAFFVIHRGDRWAVRIKDSESPVRKSFHGIDHYPLRGDWLVRARFEPSAKGTTIPVPNILGSVEDADSPGVVVFTHEGHEVRLQAIDEGDGRLFLVFGDATNGKGTYGGGRFLYADPPKPGETTVLVDFNQAYNPPCVFTPYATCPLPPKTNKLPFAVEAGEKLWDGYHHPG